jgi:endonuclease YncB( thermonuclease family)
LWIGHRGGYKMEKPKGVLTVTGMIDLAQFWPQGTSDADTAKILVHVVGPSSFSFQKTPGAPAKPTSAFAGAFMKGSDSVDKKTGKRRKPKMVISSKSQITVRLQGIDAPELHYRPPRGHINLRQHFGESATIGLATFLKTFGTGALPCRVITRVNKPNDVFDKYGRFVGDIIVSKDGKDVNVNHWLVEQGWAFPTFYDSMMVQEIKDLVVVAKTAQTKKRNIWTAHGYTTDLGTLDRTLTTRPAGSKPAADKGAVIIPKFFRRQYTWFIEDPAKKDLKAFLLKPGNTDTFVLTAAFLKFIDQKGPKPPNIKLGNAIDDANKITHEPADFVIHEAPSTLVKGNNVLVTGWGP